MKLKVIVIALFASTITIGYSNVSFAEACYDVGGTVTTENVTSTLQMGNIDLALSEDGDTVFSKTGSLIGNITSAPGVGIILLSHKARFPKGDSFVTEADKAVIVGIRDTLADGTPCSFYIHETISSIVKGTNLFKNVTSVEMSADGYISHCPDENMNYFKLSGKLCVE